MSGYQALGFVVAVAAGMGLGVLARLLLRGRVRLSWSDVLLAGIVGAVAGSLVVALANDLLHDRLPVVAAVVAPGVTVVVLLVMERVQRAARVPQGSAAELVRAGESRQVEFKSSARYNRHSGARDEKLERVVARTVAAFLNADGGVLLIGVADDGSIPGLADDYALMKFPDRDRFELWLRDMLVASLGAVAATSVVVEFEELEGQDVCLLRLPPSDRPVFVRPTKGDAAPVFVTRVGNSTRELPVDEALAYCATRWGRARLRGSAAR